MQQLKKGITLQGGKYKIDNVLGQGGFGITYLATQELLGRKVCIKEFFFKDSCGRNFKGEVTLGTVGNIVIVERFLNKFIKEARMLSQLDHPNIIRVLDVFKENNTAYYVMDFIEGSSLEEIVKTKGALSESVAIDYIKQVANALDYIHERNLNHLDIKPANIMIRKCDNKAILIDFGVSKQYDSAGDQTSTTPVGISYGYAPIEQYRPGGVMTFSPQTDIYALGATLYKIVTGKTPPQAIEIFNEGLPGLPLSLSSNLENTIRKSMLLKKDERPKSVNDFLNILITKKKSSANTPQKISSVSSNKPSSHSIKETTTTINPKRNEINGHEYVDLGLPSGLKWATCNVGANRPEESGDLYGWGNDNPHCISELKCYYPCNNPPLNISGTQYDVAQKLMGSPWRTPTKKDFQELIDYCTLELSEINHVKGYFFISKKNYNRIFVPFCDWTMIYQGRRSRNRCNSSGAYWTANRPSFILKDSGNSIDFNISDSGEYYGRCYFWENHRHLGYAIRAVCSH